MDISKWSYVLSVIPVAGLVVKTAVDNWELTDLEKKIMNNYKKFQIFATKNILLGLVCGIIATLLIIFFGKINKTFSYEILLLVNVVLAVILATGCDWVFRKIVYTFTLKFDYYIVDENENEIYRVLKLSGKDTLLVEKGKTSEFVSNVKGKRYLKKFKENKQLKDFYNGKLGKWLIIVSLTIFIASGWAIFNTSKFLQLILYLIFLLSLFFLTGIVYGLLDYKCNKEELESLYEKKEINQKGSGNNEGS